MRDKFLNHKISLLLNDDMYNTITYLGRQKNIDFSAALRKVLRVGISILETIGTDKVVTIHDPATGETKEVIFVET